MLSIISSPRGLDYTNLVSKLEKKPPCFYFSCLIQVIHKSHFRAKHLSLISGSLVFQFLCTSPEGLLNLEIIIVIITYSLYCHNTLDSQAPNLVGIVHEKHKKTPTKIPNPVQCGHFRILWYLNFFPVLHGIRALRILQNREKMCSDDRVQALNRCKLVFLSARCLYVKLHFNLIGLPFKMKC